MTQPTDQDIFNLKQGTMSAEEFDAKYGARQSVIYTQQNEEPEAVEEKAPESRITEVPEQIFGSVLNATKEIGETVGGLADLANNKFNLEELSASIREKALAQGINIPVVTIDDGKFNIRSGQEAIDYIRNKEDGAKTGISKLADVYSKTVDEAKEWASIDEPEYMHGALIAGVSQFLTGFIGGKKVLDGVGWATKKLSKEQTKKQLLKNTASNVGKTMTASAIADAVVFDEHMPRLSDMANDFGFGNPLTEYLASDINDSFAEGKFKNALEGFIIGLPLEGLFSSVRYLKLRKARSEGQKVSKKKIDKDEKDLEKIEEEISSNIDSVKNGETPKNVQVPKKVIFHSTDKQFDEFDLDKTADSSIWFSDNKKFIDAGEVGATGTGKVVTRVIDENSLKLASREQSDNLLDDQLRQDGYDGIKFDDGDGQITYKIFNPNKLEKISDSKPIPETKIVGKDKVEVVNVKKGTLIDDMADDNLGYGKDAVNTLIKNVEDYRKGEVELDEALDVGINAKNLIDTPETTIIISNVVERLKNETTVYKDIETHVLVEKRAELLMQDPMKAMVSINKMAKQIDGASKYIVAGLSLAQSYANALPKIARLIEASKNPANGVATKWTEKDFDKVVDVLATLLLDEKIIERNVGRMLNAKNIKINQADVNVQSVMKEIELIKSYGGDKKRFMRKIALMDNAQGIMGVLKWVFSNKTWNVANEVWINFLLSSPKTHLINMTSNGIMMVMRPVEQFIGGKVLKTVTRDDYYKDVSDEALDTLSGLTMFMDDVKKYTKMAFKNESGILDGGTGKVEGVAQATGTGKLGKVLRFSTRMLNVEDEVFKQMNYRAKLYAIAVREAKGLGKSMVKDKSFNGKPISDFELHIAKVFEDGFEDGVAKNAEALDWARVNTFTSELDPNSVAGFVQRKSNEITALKQILPFIRTPANIVGAVIQRTPALSFLSKRFRKDLFGNNPQLKAQAVGQQITGTAFLGSAYMLAHNDMLTGGGYEDYDLKKTHQQAGWKPYSFKVGGVYIPYGRLDPFGMFFGLVADYKEMWKHMEEKDRAKMADAQLMAIIGQMTLNTAGRLGATLVKNLASKTYLQGLADIMDAVMSADERKIRKVYQNKISSMVVPNLVSKFKFDPYYREARTITEEIASRLPFFSKGVEPRFNWLGEKDVRQGGFLSDTIFPINFENTKKDKLHQELVNMKQPIKPVPEIKGGLDLTRYKKDGKSAYQIWNELIGQSNLRQQLEDLVNQKNWDIDYSDNIQFDKLNKLKGSKVVEIMMIVNEIRDEAFEELEGMNFKSPKGNKINLGDEMEKMRENKQEYKEGAVPEELEAIL